jgi:hypothetical protein
MPTRRVGRADHLFTSVEVMMAQVWVWPTNDLVNFACGAMGAVLAVVIVLL